MAGFFNSDSNVKLMRWLFLRPRLHPQPQEQFGEILHAGAPASFKTHGLAEILHDFAALQVVPPKLRLEGFNYNLLTGIVFRGALKLSLPELSLVWMSLQVIKYPLLAPVQAHRGTVRADAGKTTAKPALAELPGGLCK